MKNNTDELSELKKRLQQMEKEAESNRKKREYITVAMFTAVFLLLFCFDDRVTGIIGVLDNVLPAFFGGCLYYVVNREIFRFLFKKEESDEKAISSTRTEIRNLEKHN